MFLGHRLNWQTYINYIRDKSMSSMRILSCLRKTWWGADSSPLLHLYISLIRSKIEYGRFLISPSAKTHLDKLQKVQNIAIRIAMGYRVSTPINVMTAKSKIPYVNIRMKELDNKYIIRCLSIDNNRIIKNSRYDIMILIYDFNYTLLALINILILLVVINFLCTNQV